MLIRNIKTGKIHEVADGTKFPAQFFEVVTKDALTAEKAPETTPVEPQETASKAPETEKTIKDTSSKKKSAPKKKKTAKKTTKKATAKKK